MVFDHSNGLVPPTPAVRRVMQANRKRDTGPELALRRLVWRRGLRYRVDARVPGLPVRRRADLLFVGPRVAVYVDGCFWHRCPEHGTDPKTNSSYWGPKLQRNVERDRATEDLLRAAGWRVVRVWEHEDPTVAADRVQQAVDNRPRARKERAAAGRAGCLSPIGPCARRTGSRGSRSHAPCGSRWVLNSHHG